MPTFNTALYNAQTGAAQGSLNAQSAFPRARDAFGKERIVQINYTMAGTEATADVINLTKLKQGDRVLAGRSSYACEALGTAFTGSIGDASNNSRYSGTLTFTSIAAGFFSSAPGTDLYVPSDVVTIPVPATDQSTVLLKVVLSTTPTAGKKLIIFLAVVAE